MAKTERSTVNFISKETSIEVHLYEDIPSLKNKHVYLHLKPGTTDAEVRELVRHLKEHVSHFAVLSF
jgi:hypothetical protein